MTKTSKTIEEKEGLYLMLISVHGLIRSHDLELGRDADTGGQTKYVLELSEALSRHPHVSRVDLLTRQVMDPKVDDDYARPMEAISGNARIIRLACGPRRYLRKEVLWPHLDSFVDNALQHIREVGRLPDFIHGHYADAGYVATRLAQLLGVPLAFTGHSLGRVKWARLLEKGTKDSVVENQYNISQRIEAEETVLGNANLMVASTNQEVREQYQPYDNYHPRRMTVIPPGVNLSRFDAKYRPDKESPMRQELARFLKHPRRLMVLAIARADERKNLTSLVRAYGENKALREQANLVIVAGNRDDIDSMDKGPREVLTQLLLLKDEYDLYGQMALPKHHSAQDVKDLYRLAAISKGVFVNPALTEPFGLTLIEAAASGLPIIATNDGGPKDIIGACENGVLVDPLDVPALGKAILTAMEDRPRWNQWARSGVRGAHKHFSWESHVDRYVGIAKRVISKPRQANHVVHARKKSRLPIIDRVLVSDIDNILLGDDAGLSALLNTLKNRDFRVGLAVATGRHIDSALKALEEAGIPVPDFLITSVGSEIHYGHGLVEDYGWEQHINYRWKPDALRQAVRRFPGLRLQAKSEQRKHKISFEVDPKRMPNLRAIHAYLRQQDLHAKLIYSRDAYLDVLPVRASKGLAIRYLSIKWGLPPERILVAGDSGNDEEMLRGNTHGLVVGNYSKELERLRGRPGIYFAEAGHAWGILEGMQHYDFLGALHGVHADDND
jgi:sucrose-phosphate synthase